MDRVVEAVVQAGRRETRYLRAGHGPPLLLLLEGPDGDAEGVLFRELARRFRVTVPALHPGLWTEEGTAAGTGHPVKGGEERDPPPVRWLRDLVDGLGLSQIHLVAEEALVAPFLSRLEADRYRIARVTLVHPGETAAPDAVLRRLDP